MKEFMKGIVFALVVLYVICPVDAVPGPMDDLIVLLLGAVFQMAND